MKVTFDNYKTTRADLSSESDDNSEEVTECTEHRGLKGFFCIHKKAAVTYRSLKASVIKWCG